MKCKKILSMLLALCMVLTTFVVSVSAADVVVVDINENYETDIGDTLCAGDISLAIVEFEGENVLKVTKSDGSAAGWQNLVGFAVTNTEETQLTIADLPEDGVISYSFDIYVPAEGGNVGDATAYLRTANAFPPAGMQTSLDELNGLTTGEWITYEGTKNVSDNSWAGDSGSAAPIWICLRPNFSAAGTFYLDNFSFTLTQTVEDEEGGGDVTPSGDIEFELAPKNVAGTLVDGVYTVTEAQLREYAGDSTSYDNCSYQDWLKIIPTTELDPTKTIKVAFDLEMENLINSAGDAYTDRTVRLRVRDASNGSVVPPDTYKATVAANTGSAQAVEFLIPVADIEGLDHFGVNVDMQGPLASSYGEDEYFEISNVVVEYYDESSEEEPDEPVVPDEPDEPVVPDTPDDTIAFTAEATSTWIESADGTFTFTAADVYENMNADTANPYTGFVRIIPETPIAKDADWTLTYDLTTSDVVDADNQGNTWLRLLDNTTTATQGKTLGYVKQVNSFADGTRTLTFTSDNMEAGGGSSTATEIVAINIAVDMSQVWAAYGEAANDGVFTISNITLVPGLPEEEPDEPVVPDEPDEPVVPDTPDDPEDPEITDELTYDTIADLGSDFETDMGDVQVGTTNIAGEIVDLDGEKVLKATASGSTTHNGIIGIAVKDADGNEIDVADLQPYDKITWSVDVYMEDTAGLPGNNGASVALRYGNWTPTNAMASLAQFGTNNVTAGQWKTFSGTKLVDDISWQSTNTDGTCWFLIRPNFTGAAVMYVDNVSFTVEKEFVPTITEVTFDSATADTATFNVVTDGIIDVDTITATIDGAEVAAANITAEAVDATNTLVTVAGLAPNTTYEFAVTGAKNSRDRDVAVAEDVAAASATTIAEIDTEATLAGGAVSYSFTNNMADAETIYAVLLRCKGNTVVETIAIEGTLIESGDTYEAEIEAGSLAADEYFRLFTWTIEDGTVTSMTNLIDLD